MKSLYISAFCVLLLLPLLLSGWADADTALKDALRLGNSQYEQGAYNEALQAYEAGLVASPENDIARFNAAQAAYLLGDYQKALEHYAEAPNSAAKFLNSGNIYLRAGDATEDMEQKARHLTQAMQLYREGITQYPQDIPLKYNYEFVKEKLEELLQDMEQEDSSQDESEDSQQEQQEEQQEAAESEEAPSGDGQEQQDATDSEETQESSEQSEDEQGYSEDEAASVDEEEIARILQILEAQEAEGFKNNKEVVGGKESGYGW